MKKVLFAFAVMMLAASNVWAQYEEPSSAVSDLQDEINCTVNGIRQNARTEAECKKIGGSVSLVPTAATQQLR